MTQYDMPESYDVSSFLDKPGQYHVAVDRVEENPVSKGGKLLDGIRLHFQVLAGTDPTQAKRSHGEVIFSPSMDAKDGGEFARKKIGRLIRALELHDKKTGELAEKCRAVSIDWEEARGRQMVVFIVPQDGNEAKYVEVQGAHFYKVSDPEVSHVPKCERSLKLMGATQTSQQTVRQQQQSPPAQRSQAPVAQQPVAVGAASGGGDNWDDLFK